MRQKPWEWNPVGAFDRSCCNKWRRRRLPDDRSRLTVDVAKSGHDNMDRRRREHDPAPGPSSTTGSACGHYLSGSSSKSCITSIIAGGASFSPLQRFAEMLELASTEAKMLDIVCVCVCVRVAKGGSKRRSNCYPLCACPASASAALALVLVVAAVLPESSKTPAGRRVDTVDNANTASRLEVSSSRATPRFVFRSFVCLPSFSAAAAAPLLSYNRATQPGPD